MPNDAPSPPGFHHLVFFCQDPGLSCAFYESLGFALLRSYEDMYWLRVGEDAEIMLHPSAEDASRGCVPVVHFAVDDVDAHFAATVAAGLTPYDHQQPDVELDGPVTRPWGAREYELDDPDGHRLAFTQRA